MKASDNIFPKLILDGVTSAPSAPTDDSWRVYAGVDGIYARSSNTTVGPFGTAGVGGSVATDTIWDAAGDLVQGTGANTAAKLTLGAAGTVVRSTGSTNAYAYPPGYEFDYAEATSDVIVSSSSEGSETTIVTGNAVTYDGSTVVMIEFFCRADILSGGSGHSGVFVLYEDSTTLGRMAIVLPTYVSTMTMAVPVHAAVRRTPSNASHTYTVKAFKSNSGATFTAKAGSGGSGNMNPMFIRITKV